MVKYTDYIKKRKFLYCCLFVSCVVMMISQVIIPIYLSNISAGMLELEWRVVRNGGIAIVILAAVRLIQSIYGDIWIIICQISSWWKQRMITFRSI